MRTWRVGVDIGGTFTDIIATSQSELRTAKTPTVRAEPLLALERALAAINLTWHDVAEVIHGTTVVTNDLVEGRLARTALVATRGFKGTIEIGRMSRSHLYHLDLLPKPSPLVSRELRFEVHERVLVDGRVAVSLDRGGDHSLERDDRRGQRRSGGGLPAALLCQPGARDSHRRSAAADCSRRISFASDFAGSTRIRADDDDGAERCGDATHASLRWPADRRPGRALPSQLRSFRRWHGLREDRRRAAAAFGHVWTGSGRGGRSRFQSRPPACADGGHGRDHDGRLSRPRRPARDRHRSTPRGPSR